MLAEEADGDIDKVIKIISFGSDNTNKEQLESDSIPVLRTEHIPNELKPEWPEIKQKLQIICNGDMDAILRFSVKKYVEDTQVHKQYGFFCSSLNFINNNIREWPLYSAKGRPTGSLKFKQCLIEERNSFSEYIKAGWYINMSVAIDYTASNGNPSEHSSLHHLHNTIPNQYEKAIRNVGSIMEHYAFQKKFAGFGFGGIPPAQAGSENNG